MRLEILTDNITITAESHQDIAYFVDTLCLVKGYESDDIYYGLDMTGHNKLVIKRQKAVPKKD